MFLIDCYPDYKENCMKIWWVKKESVIKKEEFSPWFFVRAFRKEDALLDYLDGHPSILYTCYEKRFVSLTKKAPVIKVVLSKYNLREIASEIDRMGGYEVYELFNVDISFPQRYFFEKDLFPMMNVEEDSPFAVEYEIPPLRELFFDIKVKSDRIPSFSDPLISLRVQAVSYTHLTLPTNREV